MNRKQTSQVVTGMLLVVVGIIFLGQDLAHWPGWSMRKLWPMFLIVIGLVQLISADDAAPRAPGEPAPESKAGSGLWLIFLGGLFLLHNYRVASIGKTWPLFIVVAGLSMIFKERGPAKKEER